MGLSRGIAFLISQIANVNLVGIIRRAWLVPCFAILSIVLMLLPLREYYGEWYLDYGTSPWISFYLGVCFIGLLAWESANAIRNVAPLLLMLACIASAVASVIIMMLFPFNLNHYGFILTRAPFFLTVMVGIVFLWNLVLMRGRQAKVNFKLNIWAGISLILIVCIFATGIPYINWMVTDYGQMVSFFVMAIPTVLAWEALIDNNPFGKGKSVNLMIGRTALVVGVSVIAGFLACLLGSVMWVT